MRPALLISVADSIEGVGQIKPAELLKEACAVLRQKVAQIKDSCNTTK